MPEALREWADALSRSGMDKQRVNIIKSKTMVKIKKITKAVITTAGYGTRFLPVTKAQPKEMLPLLEKPILQYVVEELVDSGIKDIIIVTRAGQDAIEDHFDSSADLESILEQSGKADYLKMVREVSQLANFVYVRQTKNYPYGNGTPLLVAAPLIDPDEAFVYLFGDDVVKSKVPATKQLIKVWREYQSDAVVGVQEVPRKEVDRYGIIRYRKKTRIPYQAEAVVEKPFPGKTPSTMALFGRFILTWSVVKILRRQKLGKGNELWMADALNVLAKKGKVIAQPIEGKWLTTGDPLRWLKANIEFALEKKEMKKELERFLKEKLGDLSLR